MIDRIKKLVFGGEREREVIELLKEHIDLIINSNELMKIVLETGDRDVISEICEIEKMGDAIRRDVMIKIYAGAFIPAIRSSFCNLAETLDDVLDELEDVAVLYLLLDEIPDVILGDLVRVAEINHRMSVYLSDAFKALESGDLSQVLLKIKISEEEVDAIKVKMYEKLKLIRFDNYPDWHFFVKFVDKLVNVSDIIEDAGDVMQILNVSIR